MTEIQDFPPDRFSELVASAAPPTTESSPELMSAIEAAAAAAARPAPRRKRVPIVAAVLAPLLVLTGAGAAFAAVAVDWSPFWNNTPSWIGWAQHPDASITYRLPGGGSCTMRIGGLNVSPATALPPGVPAADANAARVALTYLKSGTVLKDARIKDVLAKNRADVNWTTNSDGKQVRFGYGTSNYNADVEYQIAVKEAVQEAITRHLEQVGISTTGFGYESQEQCSGMQQ